MNSKSITTVSRLFTTGGILLLVIGLMFSLVNQTAQADGGPIGLGGGGDVFEPVNPPEPAAPSAPDNNPAPGPGIQSFSPSPSDSSSRAAPAQRKSYPRSITPQSRAAANILPAIPIQVFDLGIRINADGPELTIRNGCDSENCTLKAEVCNTGDEDMTDLSNYFIYYTPDVNADPFPNGEVVHTGQVSALTVGQCQWQHFETELDGNFRFLYEQPAGYTGPIPYAIGPTCTFLGCSVRTQVPTTAVPTTAVPTTAVPTTAVPTTAVPTTAVPTTPVPTTAVPTTPVPTTAVPTTAVPTTPVPTTAVPPTESITPPPPPGDDPTATPTPAYTASPTVPPPPGDSPTNTPTTPVNLTPAKSPTPGGGVLVPVTGSDQSNPASLESLMMYVGLLLLGLGLVTTGINKRLFKTNR